MKLFRFNGGRIGITVDSTSYDINEALGIGLQSWPQFPTDPKTKRMDLAGVRLDVPIGCPSKLIAGPVNYLAHGHGMNSVPRADLDGLFLKTNLAHSHYGGGK
jgi:hypothetical protein